VTEQASSGTVTGAEADTGTNGLDLLPGAPHGHEAHHGRPASWVAVSIIIIGFVVSGVAIVIPHQVWWLFWTGGGIVVIGGIMALSGHILDDWY
jgi:hypothetical protein